MPKNDDFKNEVKVLLERYPRDPAGTPSLRNFIGVAAEMFEYHVEEEKLPPTAYDFWPFP